MAEEEKKYNIDYEKAYQDYLASGQHYNPQNYIDALRSNLDTQKQLYDMYYNQNVHSTQAQMPNLQRQYDTARGDVYTMAQLSARGQNEQLARLGLAGNINAPAKSGYSEMQRLYQDTAMQGSLSRLNEEQRGAVRSIQELLSQMGVQRQGDLMGMQSQQQLAEMQERQRAEDVNYSRYQDYVSKLLQERDFTQKQEQIDWQKEQVEVERQKLEQKEAEAKEERANQVYYELKTSNATPKQAKDALEAKMITKEQYEAYKAEVQALVAQNIDRDIQELKEKGKTTQEIYDELDKLWNQEALSEADYHNQYYKLKKQEVDSAINTSNNNKEKQLAIREIVITEKAINDIKDKLGADYTKELLALTSTQKAKLEKELEKEEKEREWTAATSYGGDRLAKSQQNLDTIDYIKEWLAGWFKKS